MKTTSLLLTIICAISFGTCCGDNENCHRIILFVNSTDKDIYVIDSREYPNTNAIQNTSSPIPNAYSFKVVANSSSKNPLQNGRRDCWESHFGTQLLPSDTLMIYVLNAELVESTRWETIVNDYMILKRYDVSLGDLQQRNWTIEYPYDPAKGKLKVWPK